MTKDELEQLKKDAAFMRERDALWQIERHDFTKDPIADLNVRLQQYKQQIKVFPFDYLILQTIADFNMNFMVTQTNWKKLDRFKPVAVLRKTGEAIYVDHSNLYSTKKTVQILGGTK